MRRAWFWCVLAALPAALALWPAAAGAAVSDQQVHEAVEEAVTWIRGEQEPDGALGSNGGLDPAWSLLGLAGAGVNAADLSAGAGEPSAQDYYLALWTGRNDSNWTSTGTPQASDYERVIMLANAAGLDPLRLSSEQNLLAKLARFDDAGYFGAKGTFNQTMFALIALDQVPVPGWLVEQVAENIEANAHEDGGYTFATVETQAAYEREGEVDLTGAAIAGLCGAGRTAASPAVSKAIEFLETTASKGSLGDADSVSWALDGLGACGVKRGPSAAWTAVDEHTVESLLSQQLPDGGWASSPTGNVANFYATQDALRALDAPGFDVEPPPRLDPAEPARRQPPSVAAGTPVPVVLAIDSGFGDIQLCSTTAPAGAALPEVLSAAQAHSEPAGCVGELQASAQGVSSLNGAVPIAGAGGWKLSLDDGSEQEAADQSIGFGEVVGLRLEDPAPLSVSASSLEFAAQTIGDPDGTREVTLTNRTGSPLGVLPAHIGGAASADYQVMAQDCAGQSLAAGASCRATIAFTPSASGERGALLEVPTEGAGAVAIALHGEGSYPEAKEQPQQPGSPQTERESHQSIGPGDSSHTKTGKPVSLRLESLNARRLLLKLGGSARIEVSIELLPAEPGRTHRKHVKTITANARRAGEVKVALPHLAAGRYRVTVTATATGARSITRALTIHARPARRSR